MKKILFSTILLSMIVSSTTHLYAQSNDLIKKLDQKSLHVAAHRGAHLEQPENSIAAIEEAIRQGASVVEVDVRATKDGVLVLMHDKTVNRTTTGQGEVAKQTYAELQLLHLRKKANGEASDHVIPTLSEALRVAKGKILVDLDFKEERKEFIKKTYALVEQEGMEDQVLFFLYDYKDMPKIYKLNPTITLFPRARSMKDLTAILKMKLTSIVHLDESFTDTEKLNALRQQGIYFWMNSLGEYDEKAKQEGREAYRSFLEKYPFVRLIQTDHPSLWREVLSGS
ncbi:glycerophosphodiester phosphodiesterase family protein [Sphingobacterium paramultivorum]|uniref:Glycerophosphodiester phosphodiesterase family protein n=1 Tax=Sphingobacterium paramultivorum TaxID=2886510 RepID=A0A7G5E5L7_9SPHI|nr:glycerophosphodiester phosphodiesterase family protein [Sphingobacterium paramultivorum]QMV69292.1 glycerophosphodiester phosphodiesterase family protein [Sphingobacterium paramultivorum]WSO13088.1 glycerophosphodiester phosphodiesterase family protein [Sphingobacterium paramultivorum]